MTNFFKSLGRGASNFFKGAGRTISNTFKAAPSAIKRVAGKVGDGFLKNRGLIGNILEKAAPVLGAIGSGVALGLGQPELIPLIGAGSVILGKTGGAMKGDYSNRVEAPPPNTVRLGGKKHGGAVSSGGGDTYNRSPTLVNSGGMMSPKPFNPATAHHSPAPNPRGNNALVSSVSGAREV
jgi:hypothetical protein